jgi:hypothetical protein
MHDLGIEGRRVAIEAIATLIKIKATMGELLLKPAGVPRQVYSPLLGRRDETSGRPLSKRQIAPLVLNAIEKGDEFQQILHRIVDLTAHWTSFHLADDEFAARATVQKARELLGSLKDMEAQEAAQRETARKEEAQRNERERSQRFSKQLQLLLLMFDDLASSTDLQRRGYHLQDLLNRAFDLHEIPVVKSFTRNAGGEQIDGAFKMEGWHYLLECRWRDRLADIRQLDGLKGQVDRSGRQTMGLFLSIQGWSHKVVPLLKQNPDKSIFLMEGFDLRNVLAGTARLDDLLKAKLAKLNLEAEPFLSVSEYLKSQR